MARGFRFELEWQKDEYWKKEKVLQNYLGEISTPTYDYYRDMFPEGSLEMRGESGKGRAMARERWWSEKDKAFIVKDGPPHFIYDDLNEFVRMAEADLDCKFFSPPCSFFGEHMSYDCGHNAYGFILDIDKMTADHFELMIHRMFDPKLLPPPANYIINSGNGMHLCYLFEEPVPLYQNSREVIRTIKFSFLSRVCTSDFFISESDLQNQGPVQGYTVVGSNGSLGRGYKTTAYKLPFKKWTIEQMVKDWIPEYTPEYEKIADASKGLKRTSLDQARVKWPDWYQRRIVEQKPMKEGTDHPWTCHENMYNQFYDRILHEAQEGHRYHCIWALAVCAVKCDIPYKRLKEDAYSLLEPFNSLSRNAELNPFTANDIEDALKAYRPKSKTIPTSSVEYLTGMKLTRTKRHKPPLPVETRIQIANSVRDREYPDGSWRQGNGRPDKHRIVAEWQAEHPDGRKADCIRDTGLSKPTVLKWWDKPCEEEMYEYNIHFLDEKILSSMNLNESLAELMHKAYSELENGKLEKLKKQL